MSTNNYNHRQHAIVMGASLGGLLTARVLSKHFQQVTILEKDPVNLQPEARKGQPQTRHLHGLLATGMSVMTNYFPDLPQALADNGAVMIDFADTMQWYIYGGYRKRFPIGFPATMMSRPLLEHLLRQRVLALPNIHLLDRTAVKQLITTPDRSQVIGAIVEQHGSEGAIASLTADLVVDVTGRGSRSLQWLKELGYEPPQESQVKVNVEYSTRLYRRDPHDPRSKTWMLNTPDAPRQKCFGGIFPIEGDRWIVSMGSWHSDRTPATESAFLDYARSLPSLDIYNIISKSEPLSDIVQHKFPFSQRRYYERLTRFPRGYLVLGDAISSFNPTYGQGMTVAALQAAELDKVLGENQEIDRLAKTFFKRVAKVIDIPWQLAVGEDFRFPQTTGSKPLGTDFINHYVSRIHQVTLRDKIVCEAFLKVMNLMEPPASLFDPRIIWRVLMA
jgi:2-polyprenyl-6-methoxyphenol hydroxylase-like FAD-dependent oxidoreductase